MKSLFHRSAKSLRPNNKLLCRPQLETLEARWVPTVPPFSSLPGANHTIFLDFDGHVTTGTPWNTLWNNPSINSPPYDTDGNPAVYNAAEIAAITECWNRMAEDFYPFHVNVTTVDPGVEALRYTGGSDTQWGIRVVNTADTEGTGAGGIAYINSFNWSNGAPVFVYNTGAKALAEAGSHEVGHSMGLAHDGTPTAGYYTGHGSGATGWAPIMGVGYYREVTTWDRGEYFNSNNAGAGANYGRGPDDLAIITTFNGFGYRVDDHGNATGAATALTVAGSNVTGSGLISTTADVDFFSFTTGMGNVILDITPFSIGPNLDVRADLYDSTGVLVATSNNTAVLNAGFNINLAAGQYFLRVDGTGFGTPGANPPTGYTDYASLGRYSITGTIVTTSTGAELAINDVTVTENAGNALFTVTLTGSISTNVTVNYATGNGSALAGSDYSNSAGVLTFVPGGPTTQTISVPIIDDTAVEPVENFFVNLSNASGASIIDAQGVGTILDNDATAVFGVFETDGERNEGTGPNPTPFIFTVTRTGGGNSTGSVNWVVGPIGSKGTASANDFFGNVYPSGTANFAIGETSKTLNILVNADSVREASEYFRVTISAPSGGTIGTATAEGIIVNDDGGKPTVDGALRPHTFPRPGEESAADHHDDNYVPPARTLQYTFLNANRQLPAQVAQLYSRLQGISQQAAFTPASARQTADALFQRDGGPRIQEVVKKTTVDSVARQSTQAKTTTTPATLADTLSLRLRRI